MQGYRDIYWLFCLFFACLLSACAGAAGGELTVQNAWARPSPEGAPAAAFYMTIVNDSAQADTLQRARSDSCEAIEIHLTHMDEQDVMHMAPVEHGRLDIGPGAQLVLAPGGLHIMCIGLQEPLIEGQEIALGLDFQQAGSRTVAVAIRQQEP